MRFVPSECGVLITLKFGAPITDRTSYKIGPRLLSKGLGSKLPRMSDWRRKYLRFFREVVS